MNDKVKVKTEVKKDIPKIIAEEPALISYSKADFISTVAVLCTHDDTLKVAQACNLAAKVCQKAGEHYNEMLVAEQNRELKKALEEEAGTRYVRIEFADGDIRYWGTAYSKEVLGDDKFLKLAMKFAKAQRPFMPIRCGYSLERIQQGEGDKIVHDLVWDREADKEK